MFLGDTQRFKTFLVDVLLHLNATGYCFGGLIELPDFTMMFVVGGTMLTGFVCCLHVFQLLGLGVIKVLVLDLVEWFGVGGRLSVGVVPCESNMSL